MIDPQPDEEAESPGRTRTWWHPMLVRTLQWALGASYEVRDEVSVGRMPLRIDVALTRRRDEAPEIAQRDLAPLLPILNEHTLIEFKGPTDSLEAGDVEQFLGCVHLFRSQQRPPLARGALSLVILAPALTSALREDADRLGFALHPRGLGIWEVTGGLFPLWLLEADRLATPAESILALFSHVFLNEPKPIIERWQATGHAEILHFLVQQIQQFKAMGEPFAMQHKDTQAMKVTWEDVQDLVLSYTPPSERFKGMSEADIKKAVSEVLSPEARLEGLSAEARLEGLSPEARLEGLSEDELRRIKQLVEERLSSEPKNGDDA